MNQVPNIKIINGVKYGLVSIPLNKTKKSAEERAERYRKKSGSCRIIKYPKGYAVYSKVMK